MDETDIERELNGYQIEADRYKLSQVMRNFVSNAIKFTPVGGTISVNAFVTYVPVMQHSVAEHLTFRSVNPSKPVLRVEVKDTGCGIAKVRNMSAIVPALVPVY